MRSSLRLLALLVGAGSIGACATMARGLGTLPPGYGVTPALLSAASCDTAHFRERVAYYKGVLKSGAARQAADTPRVGQSGCEVLAMLGVPVEQKSVEVAGAKPELQWAYRTGYDGQYERPSYHLVTLQPPDDGAGLVVSAVVW